VLVVAIDETYLAGTFQNAMARSGEIQLGDAAKLLGCDTHADEQEPDQQYRQGMLGEGEQQVPECVGRGAGGEDDEWAEPVLMDEFAEPPKSCALHSTL